MRTGVFGGTFNPVHNGHIHLARTYFDALRLDRMLVIPTCLPPHKPGEQLADGADRLAMCRLAFDGLPGFEASDIELRRGQKSYTVDTLEQLAKEYPDDGFYLIMGSDMFLTLTGWREWRRICELAVICAGARDTALRGRLADCKRSLEAQGARCELVELNPLPISSTLVRGRAREKKPLGGLVPPEVAAYIDSYGLYQTL